MPRFMLFAGNTYYPSGGAEDLIALSDNQEELVTEGLLRVFDPLDGDLDWWHVYDMEARQVVAFGDNGLYGSRLGQAANVTPQAPDPQR